MDRRRIAVSGRIMAAIGAAVLSGTLAGCDGLGKKPFALQILKVNEQGPQEPAAITISDPQIYSRSTLENDRRREAALIEALLEGSEKAVLDASNNGGFDYNFKPSVVRDLVNYSALAARLQAAFNPTAGAQAQRQEREAEAASDQRVERIESDKAEVKDDTDPTGADGGKSQVPKTDPEKIEGETEEAAKLAKTLLGELQTRAGDNAGARQTQITATPLEQFRDLEAFRAELRQALSEVKLDDLHDYAGNALYRMQFMATVLPGRHKDKYGVARLTYLPPLLSDADIANLYRDWLLHLTRRMNPVLPEPRFRQVNSTAQRLESAGLISVVILNPPEPCLERVLVAVPHTPSGTIESRTAIIGPKDATGASVLEGGAKFDTSTERYLKAVLPWLANEQKYSGCVRHALRSVAGELAKKSQGTTDPLPAPPETFKSLIAGSFESVRKSIRNRKTIENDRMKSAIGAEAAPKVPEFDHHAVPSQKVGERAYVALGRAYAYATIPVERAQRLSTIARSANSLQLALSLAATLPTAGAAGGLDVGYTRSAAGNIEALERAPLVVGFAERRAPLERLTRPASDPLYASDVQAPQSGWVFGPAARINAEDNTMELVHTVASHRVATDVSLPGWWPRVRVQLETAWVGNWHDIGRPLRLEDEPGQGYHREHFDVALPRNAADFDGLTNLLSSLTVGHVTQRAEITHVEPFAVSACATNVDFVIRGANVWRSTEVRLAGVRSEDVRVLPDMDGISAAFNLDTLFSTPNPTAETIGLNHEVPLNVVSRNGMDTQTIRVLGTRKPGVKSADGTVSGANCVSGTHMATTRSANSFAIGSVAPDRIAGTGDHDREFVVEITCGREEREEGCPAPLFYLAGQAGNMITFVGGGSRSWNRVYHVSFSGTELTLPKKAPAVPLTVVVGNDVRSYPIAVDH